MGTAILNIQTVESMSNVKENDHMLIFSLCNLLGVLMEMLRMVEIAFIWVNGQEAARHQAKSNLKAMVPELLLTGSATIYASVLRLGSKAGEEEYPYRYLAESDTSVSHVPIALLASMVVVQPMSAIVQNWLQKRKQGDHKQFTVPMNLEFVVHRYGEWIMLMLGESILSLLIVDVSEDWEYYITFYAGVLSVVFLQYLHFKSQPHEIKDHAMRKSRMRAITWYTCSNFYSLALIAVGVSYKMFLTEFTDAYASKYRMRDLSSTDLTKEPLTMEHVERFLAGGGGGGELYELSKDERQERIAIVFSMGIAAVWFFRDAMILCHQGLSINLKRCHTECRTQVKKGAILVILLRILAYVFSALIFLVVTAPESVALLGFALITAQIVLRVAGQYYFTPHIHIKQDDASESFSEQERWPNVTQPTVETGPQ